MKEVEHVRLTNDLLGENCRQELNLCLEVESLYPFPTEISVNLYEKWKGSQKIYQALIILFIPSGTEH